jgi:hypothetical protein
MAGIYPRAPEAKVSWFFSSEKNTLPFGLLNAPFQHISRLRA